MARLEHKHSSYTHCSHLDALIPKSQKDYIQSKKLELCLHKRKRRQQFSRKLWNNWVCRHWFSCLSSLAGKWMCFAARGPRGCGVVSVESFWTPSHFSTQHTVSLLFTSTHAEGTAASLEPIHFGLNLNFNQADATSMSW